MAATSESWKNTPFGDIEPIPYEAQFTASEFDKLRLGLIPREMEDKWFIYFDEPFLKFHRSWTGQAVYRVKLCEADGGVAVAEAVCSADVLVQSSRDYQAELLDFLVSNLLLGAQKPFPVPQGTKEPLPGVYQHATVGRAYPERMVAPRPWWKFWR
jgi:hypothetical protein